jgi:mediator of RNA polymerase II transcription subunit 14
MLGAVKMETGIQNGARTNHDRDNRINGVNRGVVKSEPSPDKGKGLSGTPQSNEALNGGCEEAMDVDRAPRKPSAAQTPLRMNDLPEEIKHITTDIMPLSLLLTRLAQISHNQLQDVVKELATKPIPQPAVNGAPDYRATPAEDTSADSLQKKEMLLNFVQQLHAKWVKALVITEWSRKSDLVSKLIDIKSHLQEQLSRYEAALWQLATVKRELVFARLPGPDLKTALQVLSTGEVPYMPEVSFSASPPIRPRPPC